MEALVKDSLKLGFGLMRLPRLESGEIDVEQFKQMVDMFFDAGGRYFDTAYVYGGSEEATRKALCERYPRESYYLATKLNAGEYAAKNEAEAKRELQISLERTGAKYFDFYLLHAMNRNNKKLYDKYGIWDFVKQLKKEGIIKHYGFSFHDAPEVLEEILTEHPDAEFVQLQINYVDWDDSNVQSRRCYEIAARHNKPIVVMEPVKGGTLANLPPHVEQVLRKADPDASPASWAIRYVASKPQVMMVLSGMSNVAQMENNLSYMKEFKPLTPYEEGVIEAATRVYKQQDMIPCTGCSYCTPGCPMGIPIPKIFSIVNDYKANGDLASARASLEEVAGDAPPSSCIHCGQCEGACPQNLPIIEYLEQAAELLE